MIKPTIGRVVLINKRIKNSGTQAEPALVCYVHSDTVINVGGMSSMGEPFALVSIKLLQDDEVAPEKGAYAEWMPYQKAVANNTQTPNLHKA